MNYKGETVHLLNKETGRPACGKSSMYRYYIFAKTYQEVSCQHCRRKIDGIIREAQINALQKMDFGQKTKN